MFKRFRYRRIDEATRKKYRETELTTKDFILPLFIVEGNNIKEEIPSMPEVYHYSVDRVISDLKELIAKGLKSVVLFGVPDIKSIDSAKDGIVHVAIKAIKKELPKLEVITDVCLCSYTEDGHCHIGDNDKTCELLAEIALSHAKAGADIVSPSDMMDGRVFYIKEKLRENGFSTPIMSYSAKYASNFYGPFRDAAECSPKSGNRKTYQMDYSNSNEALEEVDADIEEGAEYIIVKPVLSYLDIVNRVKGVTDLPIIGYNVSGEYRMIYESVKRGWANEDLIFETLISIKRAGCDRIISYFTPYILEKLANYNQGESK